MLPSQSALAAAFPQHPMIPKHDVSASVQAKREPFPAWSAIDDIKSKADVAGKEVAREYQLASEKAQQKAGKIELYTAKYYAACTLGGLLACVSCSTFIDSNLNHSRFLCLVLTPMFLLDRCPSFAQLMLG